METDLLKELVKVQVAQRSLRWELRDGSGVESDSDIPFDIDGE